MAEISHSVRHGAIPRLVGSIIIPSARHFLKCDVLLQRPTSLAEKPVLMLLLLGNLLRRGGLRRTRGENGSNREDRREKKHHVALRERGIGANIYTLAIKLKLVNIVLYNVM